MGISEKEFKIENGEQREQELLKVFGANKNSRFKTLIGLYKGSYAALFWSVFFFAIKHLAVWILPLATAQIINIATEKKAGSEITILVWVIIMIVLFAQNVFSNYLHVYLYAKAIRSVEKNLRSTLVRKLQQLSIHFHNSMQGGRLQSKIMRDVEQIETLSSQIFISALSICLNVIVAFGIVIFKNRFVFLFFVLLVPAAAIIMATFRKKIKRYNSEFRREIETTSALVMEMVELIPVTRAHALEEKEQERINHQLLHVAEKGLKLDVLQSYFSSISWVVFQIFQVICLGFTGYMAFKGNIPAGDVVMYQSYFTTIVAQVSAIIVLLPTIAKGLEAVDSIGDILLCGDVEDSGEKKKKIKEVKGDIELRNISFGYQGADKPVLDKFNLHIKEGETVAFVGGSGAGKSTVLNLIIGFYKPTEGQIFIDGKDMAELDLKSYRTHISVVPQTSILFTGTLRENITYGTDDISEENLKKVIEAANLTDVVAELPDGLDSKIVEHGNNLSGGQRQRVSIARAFVRDPRILILDEATSALDNVSEQHIQMALNNLVKGRTTLIVAHRLSTIRNADRIVVVENGQVAEIGNYDELMAKKGKFYELQQLQK